MATTTVSLHPSPSHIHAAFAELSVQWPAPPRQKLTETIADHVPPTLRTHAHWPPREPARTLLADTPTGASEDLELCSSSAVAHPSEVVHAPAPAPRQRSRSPQPRTAQQATLAARKDVPGSSACLANGRACDALPPASRSAAAEAAPELEPTPMRDSHTLLFGKKMTFFTGYPVGPRGKLWRPAR